MKAKNSHKLNKLTVLDGSTSNGRLFSTKSAYLYSRASVLVLSALGVVGTTHAQDLEQEDKVVEEIVVTGMRSSVVSAQDIKRESAAIVDSIVAEDIGKLPDRSIAEALQRIPGVSVTRFDTPTDPEHFAGEGAGVSIRGLPQVRAELNGRDIFSANDGRSLSFDDVPAELMSGVDVYKTPTADMVEGGLGGIVNLRTRMPFDQEGQLISGTIKGNYSKEIDEINAEGSVLYSNTWDTSAGRMGLLVDFSTSEISSRADNLYNRAFFPVDGIEADTVWVTKGSDWRRNDYSRKRDGQYLAFQWEPSDTTEVYLTGFRSDAKREWYENAFFLDAGAFPEPPTDNDWVYDSNNALVSGTLTSPSGIALGTSSRISSNDSTTADISGGVKWQGDAWSVVFDLQHVVSTATREDYTLGTVVAPPSVYVANLDSSNGPTIVDESGTLNDLTNYSFGQMMSRPADNEATSDAARIDVQYDFLEQDIIQSVKAGVRFNNKKAHNKEGFTWSARVQPWNVGAWTGNNLEAPTIDANSPLMEPYSYDGFQGGDANVPNDAFMFRRGALNDFVGTTDAMIAATPPPTGSEWAVSTPNFEGNATDGGANLNSPLNQNIQDETTGAAYVRMDFNLGDDWSGNLGVRYVNTSIEAEGNIRSGGITVGDDQAYDLPPTVYLVEHSYSEWLPSLNLRFNANDELVFRFSAARGMWKPEFSRTAAVLNLRVEFDDSIPEAERPTSADELDINDLNFTFSSNGSNPMLDPMMATQLDFTWEWYFNEQGGMLYAAFFYKDVEDFFRTQNLPIDLDTPLGVIPATWESYVNVGTAEITGVEVGGTYYFDQLPEPWNGFGVSANLTALTSSADVPQSSGTAPVDTDNSAIEGLPLEGLAENTYNLALMYEQYGFYARLAYTHTSEVMQSIGPNGWNGNDNGISWKLPVFADDYGQLDFSMGYDINENISINVEAYNIGEAKTKGFIRQNESGDHPSFVYSQETRYGLSVRMKY